jgi:hypothetical protein
VLLYWLDGVGFAVIAQHVRVRFSVCCLPPPDCFGFARVATPLVAATTGKRLMLPVGVLTTGPWLGGRASIDSLLGLVPISHVPNT